LKILIFIFSLFCFGINLPKDDVIRETFDLVEINHFYDDNGKLVFDQCIWYNWEDKFTYHTFAEEKIIVGPRFNVVAWRLIKNNNYIPRFNHKNKTYESIFFDGDNIRIINTFSFRETWTQYDVELVERDFIPKECRKELKK
jgi:hypothetical protein